MTAEVMPEFTDDSTDTARRNHWSHRRQILLDQGMLAVLGSTVILVIILAAFLIPMLSPFESNEQNLIGRLQGPGWSNGDGHRHWMGTDGLGRDVLTRVFIGARFSLFISFVAVFGSLMIGTVVGLVAGYRGGLVDDALMRLVDLQLAFPLVLLALALVALLGPSLYNVILVFTLTGWPVFARTIRANALMLKKRDFVEAARGLGASSVRIMFRHILPNSLGPLTVVATFEVAKVLIFESSLSFLGLGIQAPTPTWGNMMADGRSFLNTAWWVMLFPGVVLVLTAAASNWSGDGLNSMIDPRLRQR
jgi:peptide/nickel transport system permease protein|tara:strand:- start:204 stop:1121 length:918 start_codon:yes stop_codon:yes gene_type:complete